MGRLPSFRAVSGRPVGYLSASRGVSCGPLVAAAVAYAAGPSVGRFCLLPLVVSGVPSWVFCCFRAFYYIASAGPSAASPGRFLARLQLLRVHSSRTKKGPYLGPWCGSRRCCRCLPLLLKTKFILQNLDKFRLPLQVRFQKLFRRARCKVRV